MILGTWGEETNSKPCQRYIILIMIAMVASSVADGLSIENVASCMTYILQMSIT